jgi:hypothetical protein
MNKDMDTDGQGHKMDIDLYTDLDMDINLDLDMDIDTGLDMSNFMSVSICKSM